MSLFKLFFPPVAQARQLSDLASEDPARFIALRAEQIAGHREKSHGADGNRSADEKVAKLQEDLEQASLVIESLILLLEKRAVLHRSEVEAVFHQIEPSDEKTGPKRIRKEDFTPSRAWRPV